MQERFNAVAIFVSACFISSFAGLASLLRTGEQVTKKSVGSSMLNSGIVGAIIYLLWYTSYKDNPHFLVGVCALAGLGGNQIIDFALSLLKSKLATALAVQPQEPNDEHHQADVPHDA
jgi:hypothetical protein